MKSRSSWNDLAICTASRASNGMNGTVTIGTFEGETACAKGHAQIGPREGELDGISNRRTDLQWSLSLIPAAARLRLTVEVVRLPPNCHQEVPRRSEAFPVSALTC
jgi:hypothetical protein